MEKLLPSYDNDGNERKLYKETADKQEILFFRDKKNRLIIRDFLYGDAEDYCKSMFKEAMRNPVQKKKAIELLRRNIKKEREHAYDKDGMLEYSLLVTTITGKIVGEIDVRENGAIASAKIILKDEDTKKILGISLVKTICNLKNQNCFYDEILVEDEDGEIMKIEEAIED